MWFEDSGDTENEDEQQPVCPSRSQWTQQDPGLIGMNMPELIKPFMFDERISSEVVAIFPYFIHKMQVSMCKKSLKIISNGISRTKF
jgi:hypothetical protein